MRQLIRTSKAVSPFSEVELRDLLSVARRNNSAANVVGMLANRDSSDWSFR